MAISVADLRACGTRRVALVTRDGTFEGTIDQARLGDEAIMVLLQSSESDETIVVAVGAVTEIVER